MQFISGGPDVPDRLLQRHEAGQVVFFCGAGISYPAGLPDFAGLVKQLYEQLGPEPDPVEAAAIQASRFDTAVGLLEERIQGGRSVVRRKLAEILAPSFNNPLAWATHQSLLTLGTNRQGKLRVVTTNFDRLFEHAIVADSARVQRLAAPHLPVPKATWDGLVYLHGRLPETPTETDLNTLVISSGDFGRAYLTERWAARFVGELFRNYSVCFIGYSLEDPVLRYMMDALAADRMLGESSPEMFAFAGVKRGEEDLRRNEWKAKHVLPILYSDADNHQHLHETLKQWAASFRDGVQGHERTVVEYAAALPLESTEEDNFIGRMLWALSEPSGVAARRFADMETPPSLDWLEPMSVNRYDGHSLIRFGVVHALDPKAPSEFSFLNRPAHHAAAPRMALVSRASAEVNCDEVMWQIARWLARHIDNPKLLWWVSQQGGVLHRRLANLIDSALERAAGSAAPNAHSPPFSPPKLNAAMRALWQLALSGCLAEGLGRHNFHGWVDRYRTAGLTPSIRIELANLLKPVVVIRGASSSRPSDEDWPNKQPRDLIEADVELRCEYLQGALAELRPLPGWQRDLPELLPVLAGRLKDLFDLRGEVGEISAEHDYSYIEHPSIAAHAHNPHHAEWTVLVDWVRDAWLAAAAAKPHLAKFIAQEWFDAPYPLFKRLALFAAGQLEVVSAAQGVAWLTAEANWWLFSVETQREAVQLLGALVNSGDARLLASLQIEILKGPPRSMFVEGVEPERLARIIDRELWTRLHKLRTAGAALIDDAADRLNLIRAKYPSWGEPQERDEFGSPPVEVSALEGRLVVPRTLEELMEYVLQHPVLDEWTDDDWRHRCREEPGLIAAALTALADENHWPAARWREALDVWSDATLVSNVWTAVTPLLSRAPAELFVDAGYGIGRFLQSAGKLSNIGTDPFLSLCQRMLAVSHPMSPDTTDPIGHAINHPVGFTVEALLNWWFQQSPKDRATLPPALATIFATVADPCVSSLRFGRVLLAAHTVSLFRCDPQWTRQHLLPRFDWGLSELEAQVAWEGFLWTPRAYRPLMEELKHSLLETAKHYEQLGDAGGQYARLLVYVSINLSDLHPPSAWRATLRALPDAGLIGAAKAAAGLQESAADKRAEHWTNRTKNFVQRFWPTDSDRFSMSIAESFARLCVFAGQAFPDALDTVWAFLTRMRTVDYVLRYLLEQRLCTLFPQQALTFLDRVVDDGVTWSRRELQQCLAALTGADPAVMDDPRYKRLADIAR